MGRSVYHIATHRQCAFELHVAEECYSAHDLSEDTNISTGVSINYFGRHSKQRDENISLLILFLFYSSTPDGRAGNVEILDVAI
jgi:hypothetical protein